MRMSYVRRRIVRDGVMTKLSAAAGAECVNAPIEIRSGPASAMARTLLSVIPPDTSMIARLLISLTAWRTMRGVMLSNKMISACPASAWRTCASDSTSTITAVVLDF